MMRDDVMWWFLFFDSPIAFSNGGVDGTHFCPYFSHMQLST
jgi:hypothetical protein